MSAAAVITPPAETVAEAHAVLHMAVGAGWPDGEEARTEVWTALLRLDDTLRACQELAADPRGPIAADMASTAADRVIRVMSRHCGPGWGGAL